MVDLWDMDEDSNDDENDNAEYELVDEPEVIHDNESDELPAADDKNTLVKPVDNIEEVVSVYEQFEEIKSKLLDNDDDITEMGSSYHINKSGWRKIATAFNLSVNTTSLMTRTEDGVIKYIVQAQAVAPNGKKSLATGMCGSNESNFMRKLVDAGAGRERAQQEADNPDNVLLVDGWFRELKEPREVNEHNVMATAETRARNRAISDLVGGGEVSAEEMASIKRENILEE